MLYTGKEPDDWYKTPGIEWIGVLSCLCPCFSICIFGTMFPSMIRERNRLRRWVVETYQITTAEAKQLTNYQLIDIEQCHKYIQEKDLYRAEGILDKLYDLQYYKHTAKPVPAPILATLSQQFQDLSKVMVADPKEQRAVCYTQFVNIKPWFVASLADQPGITREIQEAVEDVFDATMTCLQRDNDPYFTDKRIALERRIRYSYPLARNHLPNILLEHIIHTWKELGISLSMQK